MNDRMAFFSKSDEAKYGMACQWLAAMDADECLYIVPKKRLADVASRFKGHAVAFEDITKRDHYLMAASYAATGVPLILDGSVRYNKVSGQKFGFLHRICRSVDRRLLMDVAPFYEDVKYIYVPYSYLDREIIGFQHWYAFRENYQEVLGDGTVVRAHDFNVLADKVAPFSSIDYCGLLAPNRSFIECTTTGEEAEEYQRKKTALFDAGKSPQRMITGLSDLAHAFKSRTEAMLDLVSELDGDILLLTNLNAYADRAHKVCWAAGKTVAARSFYDDYRDVGRFDHVVYLESPIANTFLLIEFETRVRQDAHVWHIIADAKVDAYLSSRVRSEMEGLDRFTKVLWEKCREQ